MDAENSGDAVAVPEQAVTEKVAAPRPEAPEENTQPGNPPAGEQESEQLAVNGHDPPVGEAPPERDPDSSPPEQDGTAGAAGPPEDGKAQQPEAEPDQRPEPGPEPGPEPEVEPQAVPEPMAVEPPGEQKAPQEEPAVDAEKVASPESGVAPPQEVAENGVAAPEQSVENGEASSGGAPEDGTASNEEPVENGVASSVEAAECGAAAAGGGVTTSGETAPPGEPVENGTASSEEALASSAAAESEQVEADPPEEEDPDPASGSLSFALLERHQTRDALRVSRTLVVLQGLPGSGKTFLSRAIADAYKDNCFVVRGDDHGIKPEAPESCADGYRALDDAVAARCGEGAASSVMVVVDDTNHTLERLVRLSEVAKRHHLVPVFLEPRTEWRRDPERLSKRTGRGLEASKVESMKTLFLEASLPLYFGWFLLSPDRDKVRCTALDFVKTLDTLDAFKKHLPDFTGKAEGEVDLEHYFKAKGALHCTAKFCNYGKAEGAEEYAENPAIRDFYGSVSELSLTALFVTPRTVGARVSLAEEQLLLWPADAEKEAEPAVPGAASLAPGSRAHVTLGCADGVQPVQTGLDLLEILALQERGQQGATEEEMELGRLTYFGAGRWLLALREPMVAPACFSSSYGKKTEAGKPEKKKKSKCAIL